MLVTKWAGTKLTAGNVGNSIRRKSSYSKLAAVCRPNAYQDMAAMSKKVNVGRMAKMTFFISSPLCVRCRAIERFDGVLQLLLMLATKKFRSPNGFALPTPP